MKPAAFWRYLLLALLLANLLFWAWSQGYLRLLGLGPTQVEEPERLQQQVAADALTLRAPDAPKSAEDEAAPEDTPTEPASAAKAAD